MSTELCPLLQFVMHYACVQMRGQPAVPALLRSTSTTHPSHPADTLSSLPCPSQLWRLHKHPGPRAGAASMVALGAVMAAIAVYDRLRGRGE